MASSRGDTFQERPAMPTTPTSSAPEALASAGFLSLKDAAQFLSISRAALYALMDKGQLPYAKFGRSRRIPRKALHDFAEGCIVDGGAPAAAPERT
jgi:excisionase family DNA binding protein